MSRNRKLLTWKVATSLEPRSCDNCEVPRGPVKSARSRRFFGLDPDLHGDFTPRVCVLHACRQNVTNDLRWAWLRRHSFLPACYEACTGCENARDKKPLIDARAARGETSPSRAFSSSLYFMRPFFIHLGVLFCSPILSRFNGQSYHVIASFYADFSGETASFGASSEEFGSRRFFSQKGKLI